MPTPSSVDAPVFDAPVFDAAMPGVTEVGGASGSLGYSPAVAELIAAVQHLSRSGIAADAGELVEVHRQLDHLQSLLTEAQTRFDQYELWRHQGAGSLRGWLAHECTLSRRSASQHARLAQRMSAWPDVASAWRSGHLVGAKVEAMVAIIPPRFVALFSEHAPGVIPAVASLCVNSTEKVLRQWVHMAEAGDGPEDFTGPSSTLHASTYLDGSLAISGQLQGADAALVEAALRVFAVPDSVDENGQPTGAYRSFSERTAAALVAMAQCALDHRNGPGEIGRFQPHVSLVVDITEARAAALRGAGVATIADLDRVATAKNWNNIERAWFTEALAHHGQATTADGTCVTHNALNVLSCDSVLQRVLVSGSKVLNLGTEVRTASPGQRRAIIVRDRHCRAPGCQTKPRFCQVHHIDHWALGGRTDVDRMVLLCGTHHREFHKPGYKMEFSEDGTFTVSSSRGWRRSTVPDRPDQLFFPMPVQ
ncbi:MAG: DUF222 domain-containing protein [Acidimicrobiales bacterium]